MFCREIKHKKKDKDDKTLKKHKRTQLNIFSSNKKPPLPRKHICFFVIFFLGVSAAGKFVLFYYCL